MEWVGGMFELLTVLSDGVRDIISARFVTGMRWGMGIFL